MPISSLRGATGCVLLAGVVAGAAGAAGAQEPPFIRGDANDDATIDLTDAVFTLGCLFLGGPCPSCFDRADADDDGEVVLSDAVYTLNHLFLGGPILPAPYPAPGYDPTTDDPFPCGDLPDPGFTDVIITEIHYHPLADDPDDEFVEIYNRGTRPVDLAGWEITGINHVFGAATLAPGAYLAVARNAARLRATYGEIAVVGDYTGQLDDGGETIRLENARGDIIDRVQYDEDGLWPRDPDGYGSSLELRDLRADSETPFAWGASDEAAKSPWTDFQFTSQSTGSSDELHVLLLTSGECLVDNLRVRVGTQDRLANGSFESGSGGWIIQGTHSRSSVTATEARDGSRSLHLVAAGRGDTASNRIEADLTSPVASGQSILISGSARWLRGSRFLLTRLHGNAVARTHELEVSPRSGTPGAPNSIAVLNRGPEITDVIHSPVLPRATQDVVVSATLFDRDDIGEVTLRYRRDAGADTAIPMRDDGTNGDAFAGDGIHAATIPRQTNGSVIGFWVEAADGLGARSRFPADAPTRRALYRVGDPDRPASRMSRYHVVMPPETVAALRVAPKMSNELFDVTFVVDGALVYYNAGIRYRGSPFIRSQPPTDPVGGRYAYRIDLAPGALDGREELNLDNLEPGRDPSLQREKTAYILYRELGLPYSETRYVRLWINGNDHGIYGDIDKIDNFYIRQHYPPEEQGGDLHKVDDYFEFDDAFNFSNRDATITYRGASNEEYRWNWEKRDDDRNDDYTAIKLLAQRMNAATNYEASVESVLNTERFAASLACRRTTGDWDSLGYRRGKNNYVYLPPGRTWELLPWDIDFVMGAGSDGPTTSLFGGHDGAINRFLDTRKYKKQYLQAFRRLVDGPLRREFIDPLLDETYDLLRSEDPSVQSPSTLKSWISQRRDYILAQLPSDTLIILTNDGEDFSTSQSRVTITGDAPLEVETFYLNGERFTPASEGISGWSFSRSIPLGLSTFLVEGYDENDALVGSASISVLRVEPCVPSSVTPPSVPAGVTTLAITGSGFVTGTAPRVRLTSASDEPGFNALYAERASSFADVGAAESFLNSLAGASRTLETTHLTISRRTEGGGEIFPTQPFPPPWNTGSVSNLAARYTGFVTVPSAGTRTFGVHSDDGFRLRIDGRLVAEYPPPRGPDTTTGTFNFPAAGTYSLQLDWYENGGGDIVQFFQETTGGVRRLVNDGSEATVTVDDPIVYEATAVRVLSATTLECDFDLAGAPPGLWNVVIMPEEGDPCVLAGGVEVQ